MDPVPVQRRARPTPRSATRTEDGELVDFSAAVSTAGVESRTVAGRTGESYRGDAEAAAADIGDRLRAGWRVVLTAEGHGLAQRMAEVLTEHEHAVRVVDAPGRAAGQGLATIVCADLQHGFLADGIELALFTAGDLSGQRTADKASRKMPVRRKNQIDPLELQRGDAVVHSQHGVGRYVEMTQRTVAGATREYLVIEYAPSKRGSAGRSALRARWTPSTRSPATSAARARPWTRWAAPTGPSARAGLAAPYGRSPPS